MRLPCLSSTELPTDPPALILRLDAMVGEGFVQHGYLRARQGGRERFLFFLGGKTHSAGEIVDGRFVSRGVKETVRGLVGTRSAEYCATDLPLLLCTEVPFRKAPAASIPLELVDPATLLASIASTEKDAVLVVRRGDAHTLVFCNQGTPRALYSPEDEPFPQGQDIADRIVEYVVADSGRGAVTLDVYDQIHLPPAKDAGETIAWYQQRGHGSRPAPARTDWLTIKLGDRVVYDFPMMQDEIVVGRGLEADLQLDNLSVSRRHAMIRRDGEALTIVDLGGSNGLVVGGERFKTIELGPTTEVGIGKYTLVRAESEPGEAVHKPAAPRYSAIEKTITIDSGSYPVLEHRGEKHRLYHMMFTIGSDERSNVRIRGWFVAPTHVRILRQDDGSYDLVHVGGRRAVRLNGKVVREAALRAGDEFTVAGEHFRIAR